MRSFQDTKATLFLIRCTMQVCTMVCGKIDIWKAHEAVDHGNQDVVDALTPRTLSSLTTLSQNLAPSVCSIQSPSTSFSPFRP